MRLDVDNYDCGVFNIATTTFPSSGSWELTLTVSSGNSTESNSVNIEL